MRAVLVTVEVVLSLLALATLFVVVSLMARRWVLARSGELLLCSLRPEGGRWSAGLLRLEPAVLSWMPVWGLTTRPKYVWVRRGLDLSGPRAAGADESLEPQSVRTALRGAGPHGAATPVDIAISRGGYTALRAWVEAGPPAHRPVDW